VFIALKLLALFTDAHRVILPKKLFWGEFYLLINFILYVEAWHNWVNAGLKLRKAKANPITLSHK